VSTNLKRILAGLASTVPGVAAPSEELPGEHIYDPPPWT
jgi:hypothetical protein